MSESGFLTPNDEERVRDLLVGRRIVKVEQGNFEIPDDDTTWRWNTRAEGRCVLDDGTQIFVLPNEGCGGCSSGWYQLKHLATVDNAITDVRLTCEGEPSDYGDGPQSYRIYVLADAVEINAVQVDGDDGNGYYGSGYELFVLPPEASTP
jgi:succinylarginine dihydrolase